MHSDSTAATASESWGQGDEPWFERVSGISVKEFDRRFRRPRRPVILTDASRDWPAHQRYSFDYFKREYGERTLRVQGREQRLDDVIDQLIAATPENPGPYPCTLAGDATLHAELSPRFAHAVPTRTGSSLLPTSLYSSINHLEIFFGAPGGQFPRLHFDVFHMHTFVTQVVGEKMFTLYAPGQEALLYVNPATPWMSMVKDVDNPDPIKFPLLRQARKQEVHLREGDTLFMPCGTWHTARCVTNSITVAFDHLDRTNWPEFSNDSVGFVRAAGEPLKAALLSAWLRVAGTLLTMREQLGAAGKGSGWN